MTGQHHVVVVGGGFGGLRLVMSLKRSPVKITLLDRRNFHLFQPLLYQVAMGGLSPANIASPLREILKRQKNVQVLLGEVSDIDPVHHKVILCDEEMTYDSLVLAAGASHHYFGHADWEKLAPGLKTIEDATEIRRRVLLAFEAAERATDLERIKALLTFVVVGGGPTGVEMAGALAEIARDTLKHNFRVINPAESRIILLEGTDRVLPPFPPKLSSKAKASLERLGVTVRTNALVTDIQPDRVMVREGDKTETIPTHTVLWAAGVDASPLGKTLARATGVQLDRSGRVMVQPDLTIPGYPNIFVIGDMANFSHQTGKPLPGVAPTAMQQGKYVAQLITARLAGKTLPPFVYKDHGNLATIGRASAVADLGRLKFSGYLAWLTWLFVHLINIVEYESRVMVLLQWGWNYFTRNRSARLITGPLPTSLNQQDESRCEGPRS
ncbi:MAG TPA: NAD(P)/FAD-dependent oxidoreductase [Gemmataceae bacterium]|nr:NAD(P)/FAD-dependent oxidoreductase [Gemmataceae bacterium]